MKNLKTCLYEKLNIHKINIQKENLTYTEFCDLMQYLINDDIDSDDFSALQYNYLRYANIDINDLQFNDITTNNLEENYFINRIQYKAQNLDHFKSNYCIKHGSRGYFLQYANINIKEKDSFKRGLQGFRYAYLSDDLENYRIFKLVGYNKK